MTRARTKLPVEDAYILERYFLVFLETSKAQMDYSATTLKCTVTREITDMHKEHFKTEFSGIFFEL